MAEDKKKKPVEESQELLVPNSPSEITQENAHLVDFDNLKVRLICLVTVPNAFMQVSNFLTRRGWEVFVTTEIKDALAQASTFKPDFVLMSVNHSHKKLNQFPQIVTQTFNVPVIGFGEKIDSKTMGAIQSSRASYKIMGHLSGPTAQRKIKQILQDKYLVAMESKERNRAFENIGNNSENSFEEGAVLQKKGDMRFVGIKRPQKGTIIFEKNQSEMKNSTNNGYNPFAEGKTQEPGEEKNGEAAYKPLETAYEEKATLGVAEKIQKDKEDMAAALKELGSQNGSKSIDNDEADISITAEGIGAGNKMSAKEEAAENKNLGSVSSKKDGYTMESEYIGRKEKPIQNMESKDIDQRSFIEKATIEIVEYMQQEDHDNEQELRMVSRIALLSVGHDHHKGYFMIAGQNIGMSLDKFVQEFSSLLKKHCVEKNEVMEFGDYINMDCPGYDFFDNGEDGLAFTLVTGFGSGKIGIKFIHDEEAWAHAEKPDNHNKSRIKAEQIIEDKPLEIDLFIHLKKNKKYYKIVNKKSDLTENRKDRLIEKETEVFINNEDVGTYRSFQTKQKALRTINKTVQRTTKKKAS